MQIRCLQTNWGGEYRKLQPLQYDMGITFRHPYPHTHQQNGKVERRHRSIVETDLTLLAQASMDLQFWWEASMCLFSLSSALQQSKNLPSRHLSVYFWDLVHFIKATGAFIHLAEFMCMAPSVNFDEHSFPYKSLFSQNVSSPAPSSTYVQNFGGPAFVIPTFVRRTVAAHGPAISLENSDHTPVVLVKNSSHKLEVFPAPVSALSPTPFSEQQTDIPFIFVPFPPSSPSALSTTRKSEVIVPFQSKHPMQTRSKNGIFKPKLFTASIHQEPATVSIALTNPHWKKPMEEEFQPLSHNHTLDLVPRTAASHIIQCKWVFRTKFKVDGSLDKYKARLVAKGFQQTFGVDFS